MYSAHRRNDDNTHAALPSTEASSNSHKTLSLGFCEFPRILCSLAVCLLGCGFLRSVEIDYIIVLSLFGGHEDQRTSFPPASGAVLFRMYSVSLAAVSEF
jgi:hypothetical protein